MNDNYYYNDLGKIRFVDFKELIDLDYLNDNLVFKEYDYFNITANQIIKNADEIKRIADLNKDTDKKSSKNNKQELDIEIIKKILF